MLLTYSSLKPEPSLAEGCEKRQATHHAAVQQKLKPFLKAQQNKAETKKLTNNTDGYKTTQRHLKLACSS